MGILSCIAMPPRQTRVPRLAHRCCEVSSGDKVQEATNALSKIFLQDQEVHGDPGTHV